MYLDDEHDEKLNIVFEELQGAFRREHGRKLEKNRDFYPAVVRSLYEDTSLQEELDLDNGDS